MIVIKNFLLGKTPLWRAYWIWGVLGSVMLGFLVQVISITFGVDVSSVSLIVGLLYVPFVTVGVWRSSITYAGSKWYSIGARVAVLLSWIPLLKLVPISVIETDHSGNVEPSTVLECVFSEIRSSKDPNPSMSLAIIQRGCESTVANALGKKLDAPVSNALRKGATYEQIARILEVDLLRAGRLVPRESYTDYSECLMNLARGGQTVAHQLLIQKVAADYCYQISAVNLSRVNAFKIGDALERGYSYEEVYDHLSGSK